ncbi:MAG: type III-B CRISPR module-associated protein Cmr5 [Fervidobacterium sp.]|uniref:type III-B CRISPR module-associated protein Cmr5 n=1 Tax=Fervidobacterium sp. TaxID=1871331 RepID=UPI0025C269A7|nr:type III-B CRISPR module-associated protein Cmr5 [Fervidobacterium sp.]NPU90206.1 type III-B CRISPR module-associated protein Cmr5 [Fervidobacterium sp.]
MTEVIKKAVECVREIDKTSSKEKKDKYLSTVKGLASMIIQNGLYGTILFLKVKGHDELIKHLDTLVQIQTGEENFSQQVIDGTAEQNSKYFKIQYAALEGVKWLRRYADIYLGGEEND